VGTTELDGRSFLIGRACNALVCASIRTPEIPVLAEPSALLASAGYSDPDVNRHAGRGGDARSRLLRDDLPGLTVG
jgi:hypothetical protein